jgi:hypothetical protein
MTARYGFYGPGLVVTSWHHDVPYCNFLTRVAAGCNDTVTQVPNLHVVEQEHAKEASKEMSACFKADFEKWQYTCMPMWNHNNIIVFEIYEVSRHVMMKLTLAHIAQEILWLLGMFI